MPRARLPIALLCLAIHLSACQSTPTVPTPLPNTNDPTPPQLKLGSAGLKKDVLIDQSSTAPELRRAKRSDEILLLATAEDLDSGIKSVTLDITLSVTCGQTGTHQTFAATQEAPANTGSLPVRLSKSYVFKVAPARAGCQSSPSSVTLSARASAENGVGTITQLQPAHISSFGPDTLKVATFNLYAPGNHPDATFERWGRELGVKADVLLLTEVVNQRQVELLANAAGMAYVIKMSNGDVAIASRAPLYDVQTRVIDPPGRLSSNDSNILSAVSDIGGYPHQLIATHWGIRDANDVLFGPETSSPSRLLAAQAIVALMTPSPRPVVVGGDLNAFSGFGPQDHDDNGSTPDYAGSTAEVDFLRSTFRDAFVEIIANNPAHCSNKRIDYVMARGQYVAKEYAACFGESSPSDHPFVLTTFEAGDL